MIHFLLLHGNFGAPSDWAQLTPAISSVGAGATFDIPSLWSLDSADPLGELVGRIEEARGKGGKVVVVGYSLGARLALELMARRDTGLDGVVLCSVHPGLTDPAARRDRLMSDSVWATKVSDGAIPYEALLREWNTQAVFSGSAVGGMRAFTSPDEERIVRASIARGFREWSLGALPPRWATLETAKCPVLCLAGEHDTKFRLTLEAIERLPNSRITCGVIPGAGHRIVLDSPAAVGFRVSLFLERAGVSCTEKPR